MPTLSDGGGGWGGDIRHFNRSRRITVAVGTADRINFLKAVS